MVHRQQEGRMERTQDLRDRAGARTEPAEALTSLGRPATLPHRSEEIAAGGVVLVLADASTAREQLVTDLVVLGYRPMLHPEAERSPTQPGPGVALILTDDVRNHAVPHSEALRRTEGGRSLPLLWLVDESDLGDLLGNEHLLDEFLTVPYPTAELGARLALLRHRSSVELDDAVRRGPLVLNPLTYQVRLDGRALDLT